MSEPLANKLLEKPIFILISIYMDPLAALYDIGNNPTLRQARSKMPRERFLGKKRWNIFIGQACVEVLRQYELHIETEESNNLRSRIGGGRLRSNLEPTNTINLILLFHNHGNIPPGAVGGLYGSGCL
jgi:hypothetical protein